MQMRSNLIRLMEECIKLLIRISLKKVALYRAVNIATFKNPFRESLIPFQTEIFFSRYSQFAQKESVAQTAMENVSDI